MKPSASDFSKRLCEQPDEGLEAFAQSEIMTGLPFIFANDAEMLGFQEHVSKALGISQAVSDVLIVGSAKTGFSLDPDSFATPFRRSSDIDVVVVHSGLFDEAWRTMLAWDYLSKGARSYDEYRWLIKRHDEVWSGWYDPAGWYLRDLAGIEFSFPATLKPLRDLAHHWFSTFRALSRYKGHPEIPRHKVAARLYRTRTHAAMYHAMGLRVLRNKLTEEQKNAL